MNVIIGSDHGGFELKKELIEYLKSIDFNVIDKGPYELDPTDDFPNYAKPVCEEVLKESNNRGVLICRTGIGMSIVANKFKGIMCARVLNEQDAEMSRMHNNANVIAIPGTLKAKEAFKLVEKFLITEFLGDERLIRRINQIENC